MCKQGTAYCTLAYCQLLNYACSDYDILIFPDRLSSHRPLCLSGRVECEQKLAFTVERSITLWFLGSHHTLCGGPMLVDFFRSI